MPTRPPAGAEAADASGLALYAQRSSATRGRRRAEPDHPYRDPFQRDRDRIIHSRAFRRLEYKTQVFVNHEGDHYRTRLTHSIEVSQIGRTVARALRVNEDLVETLALSHDLGHAPFGHLGEEVLDRLLVGCGGFDHNRQTLRIVEKLEDRYADFPGLNLTWEVREGIAKHSGTIDLTRAPEFCDYEPLLPGSLECQLIDFVDEIAYNHHDVDDGLDSGLLDSKALAEAVPLFGCPLAESRCRFPGASQRQLHTAALRRMIDRLVTDLIETTRGRVQAACVESAEQVRGAGCSLVGLSSEMAGENRALKQYLAEHLYRHHRIERMKDKARRILEALFERYRENPRLIPQDSLRYSEGEPLDRALADYIAGMTDRYAIQEYQRLFDPALPT